jgi:hypothetical protein
VSVNRKERGSDLTAESMTDSIFGAKFPDFASVCGIVFDGRALCWGSGISEMLGSGDDADRWQPTKIAGSYRFSAIYHGATTYAIRR